MRIIDYDKFDEWMPWLDEVISGISPPNLVADLGAADPEFIEDAADFVREQIGVSTLQSAIDKQLSECFVRVYHGTRLTQADLKQIQSEGLKPLILADRREKLVEILSQHPEWPDKRDGLEAILSSLGPDWEKHGSGRREDGSVHACFSRYGLLKCCNHYLVYGAEVDGHVAYRLFGDKSGHRFLQAKRKPFLISFLAQYPEASKAASPYGHEKGRLDNLSECIFSTWAFKRARPEFRASVYRNDIAARFAGPIAVGRIEKIEPIDDAELGEVG